jgi:hypothetical protein
MGKVEMREPFFKFLVGKQVGLVAGGVLGFLWGNHMINK